MIDLPIYGSNSTEIRDGIRHALASARIYGLFQKLVGAYAWRRKVVGKYVATAIPDGGLVIDIGCGTAEVLSYLPDNVEYIGFDRNPGYITRARASYAHRNASFYCEELSPNFTLEGRSADVILAFGLIHHLDDAMSLDLFGVARKMLGVNGFLVTLDPVYVDGQSAVARYIISKDRGTAVRTERAYKELASREFSSVETYIDSNPLYIPYTGIVLKCSHGRCATPDHATVGRVGANPL